MEDGPRPELPDYSFATDINLVFMKSTCLVFGIACLTGCATFSSAQSIWPGLRFGISVPDIKGNTEQSKGYSSRLAPYFGLSLTKRLSSSFNLQTEVNYSPQGGKRNGLQPVDASQLDGGTLPPGTVVYANFKNETRLNYLEVPLLAQYYISKPGKTKAMFYLVNLGPYLAFRIKAKTVTSGTSQLYLDSKGEVPLTLPDGSGLSPQSFDQTTNIKDEIKALSAGIIGGFGAGYDYGGHRFFIEARFTRGLTNIQTHPEINGSNKTGSLIFSAGYICAIK